MSRSAGEIAMIFEPRPRGATAMAFRAALASSAGRGWEKPRAQWVRWRISLASSAMEMRGERDRRGLGRMARGVNGRSWFSPQYSREFALQAARGLSRGILGPAPRSWQTLLIRDWFPAARRRAEFPALGLKVPLLSPYAFWPEPDFWP